MGRDILGFKIFSRVLSAVDTGALTEAELREITRERQEKELLAAREYAKQGRRCRLIALTRSSLLDTAKGGYGMADAEQYSTRDLIDKMVDMDYPDDPYEAPARRGDRRWPAVRTRWTRW